jgi:pullulanase-type alpha-1,6-glucosidase
VLDDVFVYDGPLGVTFEGDAPTLRVWAPTAKSVALMLLTDVPNSDVGAELPMALDPATGVWSITGAPDWKGQYYLYKVEVYVPKTGQVETNFVTDPYSFSLSMNSARSQIVDLNDATLKPEGWDALTRPPLDAPEDAVLYELHVRDFSISDPTVPAGERGTFKAFTHLDSNGMKHLKALADAGLTHIHLLPAFDIASINEDKSTWQTVDDSRLAGLPPNSEEQTAAVDAIREQDGFNWGYDPYHFTTPEGSYSTDPNGPARIREFREMVQALDAIGLRVVMDVVYNHTNASGQNEKSVLDKIVPGYYHRLNPDGLVETSTCCQNTATEHKMMEKLMIDSVVTWAAAYKVDGFRFDLMGHHMLSNMKNVRAALDALTLAKDGVDGKAIYVYGEGWNFGEVANNARGVNATQLNIGGTGIGAFNDRLRDGARGGGPFSGLQEQGFVTGLSDDPNATDQGSAEEMKAKLLRYEDWIRLTLAGNLRDYVLVDRLGSTASGAQVDYNGQPAGYTLDPQENIVYVSAHDNETLFDAIQAKAALGDAIADRVRMQNMGNSLVMLAQGVPFFHAGDDMLRSKSLDRNSYNSGDWFNRLDFTYQSNNWGVGLPPEGRDRWTTLSPLLEDPNLRASEADILSAAEHFREMLALRRSSPLFRLRTAEDVLARLSFLNTGPQQIPGLIVMSLSDVEGEDLDPNYERIVVLFNANKAVVAFTEASLKGLSFELHPIQQDSADAMVKRARFDAAGGEFTVPGRTTAVFVLGQTAPTAVPPTPTVAPALAPTATPAPAPQSAPDGGLALWYIAAMAIVAVLVYVWRRRSIGR